MKRTNLLVLIMVVFINITTFSQNGKVFQSRGVPANPKASTEYLQPDGSKLTITMHGDAVVNWATTIDGYTLLMNQNNGFEYAIKNTDGDLMLSGVIARNPNERDFISNSKLINIPTGLRYSKKQLDYKIENHLFFKNYKGSSKSFPTTGTRKLIMILANFSNTTTTYTQTQFNNYMNQSNYNSTGSFKDYFLDASYGLLTVNTTVSAWVTLPNTHNYYGPDAKWGEFAYDAIQAANATVDFSQFDNDGDGVVDGVAIIHQGIGQEESGSTNDIWSHSWDLSSAGYSAAQRTVDGVKVNSYTTQPEKSGGSMATIGVICHEFGHNLGAPDYYDTNYNEVGDGQYDGTGDWDLQAGGSYNGSPSGSKPAHPNAYTKCYIYNWATPTELSTGQNVTVSNSSAQNTNSFYRYNTTTSNEYYLIENRQKVGFDAGLPGHGMMIYHVDGTYIAAHINNNEVNINNHQGMYPMSAVSTTANGIMLSSANKINVGGCTWPGTSNKTTFTDVTTPNSKSWANANTAKPITLITENTTNKTISFVFMGGSTCVTPTTQATSFSATAIVDNSMTINWTRGNGNKVLVLAHKSSAVNSEPINGTSYTANAAFGSGTQIETGNYVVYNGTGTNVIITGLTTGTAYYYSIYEYTTATSCYKTPALTGNATTTGTTPCTYCNANGTTDYPTGITLVNFNTINNITAKPAGYNDYTATSTTVTKNSTYNLTVNVNTAGNYIVHAFAWIDWNQDCDFDDAEEAYDLGDVANKTNGPTSLCPKSIIIPSTATTGSTRMRIIAKYSSDPSSCQTSIDGEVEDYTINVSPATATPTIFVNPSSLAFGNQVIATTSTEKTYTLTGSDLTANITVTAPTGYEISKTTASGFATTLSFTPTTGSVNATVYVRFKPTLVQSYNGNITNTSTGATSQNVALTGAGTEIPVTTYTVNYSVINGDGAIAATVDASAILTGATVNSGKDVIFTATPNSGYQVKEWKLNNSVIVDNTANTYTLTNISTDATVTVEFVVVDAIVDVNSMGASVYPNPSNGLFTIELNNAENKSMTIEVVDVLGKSVLTETFTNASKNTIDLSKNQHGIYNLIIKIDSQTINSRIVIK